jgi:hypothetical protein
MSIFTWLFGTKAKLNALESRIVETIVNGLPDAAAVILKQQIGLINKVQRLDGGKEVDLYHMVNGKPAFPADALFLTNQEELELAKLHLRDGHTGHQAEVKAWVVQGRLFSLHFNAPPGDLEADSELEIKLLSLADPMK